MKPPLEGRSSLGPSIVSVQNNVVVCRPKHRYHVVEHANVDEPYGRSHNR
jgi:hypothetical protein